MAIEDGAGLEHLLEGLSSQEAAELFSKLQAKLGYFEAGPRWGLIVGARGPTSITVSQTSGNSIRVEAGAHICCTPQRVPKAELSRERVENEFPVFPAYQSPTSVLLLDIRGVSQKASTVMLDATTFMRNSAAWGAPSVLYRISGKGIRESGFRLLGPPVAEMALAANASLTVLAVGHGLAEPVQRLVNSFFDRLTGSVDG